MRRALGRRFDVLVSADRHVYEYQDLLTRPTVDRWSAIQRIDTTWNYAGSLGYRIGQTGASASASATGSANRPTRIFRDYDNLRFGTTVTYGF